MEIKKKTDLIIEMINAEEMAWSIKCLPCKRKDWSLFIHKPHNKPSMVGSVYNLSSSQVEIKDTQIPIVLARFSLKQVEGYLKISRLC